ncbi:MscL family protein [Candidatus Saccharibacteria bacterium]|nr:MscL family protein [Candidatus Saccharibacteria bacterium]
MDKKEAVKEVVKEPLSGFMSFIREQGVVGLAVGLTLGTAVTVFVKSIVDNMVNPIIGLLLPGSSNLNDKFICLDKVQGVCTNKLSWGVVLSNLISFLTIAAVVYFVVHGLRLDKLDKKKEDKK